MPPNDSTSFASKPLHRLWRSTLSILLIPALWGIAAADDKAPSDGQIAEMRSAMFRETRHGVPSVTPNEIDRTFAARLYTRDNALGSLERILAGHGYKHINAKLGTLRANLSTEIWAEIANEYRIRLELNNAGKTNGARSDLDVTLYTDARRLYGLPDMTSEQIHGHLIEDFKLRWKDKTGGRVPADFDHMVFSGDGMMMDWRMSKSGWAD